MRTAAKFILAVLAASWTAAAVFLVGLTFADKSPMYLFFAFTPLVGLGMIYSFPPSLVLGGVLFALSRSYAFARHLAVWAGLGSVAGLGIGLLWNAEVSPALNNSPLLMLLFSTLGGCLAALIFRAVAPMADHDEQSLPY